MTRLSVCIEMFWPELAFEERVARVGSLGIPAVEFWNHSNKNVTQMAAAAKAAGVAVAGFVCEPGFALTSPLPVADHVQGVRESAAVARTLGCSTMIVTTGNVVAGESDEMTRRHILRKLQMMAAAAAQEGMTLVLEPLNPFVDHPGYWLTTMAQAADLVEEVDSPNLKILYDIYHQQMTEGKILDNLRKYVPKIGHIHVAGAPGRTNLVGGDLDYRAVFAAIDAAGYAGHVGLEFRPTGDPDQALREAMSLCLQAEPA
jgi:hydroxypyruvate isomerase